MHVLAERSSTTVLEMLSRLTNIFGWLLSIYGALAAGTSAPVLYLLLTGAVRPGEPYFVDEIAPSQAEAIASVAIGIACIAAGAVLTFVSRKRMRGRHDGEKR